MGDYYRHGRSSSPTRSSGSRDSRKCDERNRRSESRSDYGDHYDTNPCYDDGREDQIHSAMSSYYDRGEASPEPSSDDDIIIKWFWSPDKHYADDKCDELELLFQQFKENHRINGKYIDEILPRHLVKPGEATGYHFFFKYDPDIPGNYSCIQNGARLDRDVIRKRWCKRERGWIP